MRKAVKKKPQKAKKDDWIRFFDQHPSIDQMINICCIRDESSDVNGEENEDPYTQDIETQENVLPLIIYDVVQIVDIIRSEREGDKFVLKKPYTTETHEFEYSSIGYIPFCWKPMEEPKFKELKQL